ncbi:MAG: DUF4433 domain-containing protein [Polyangiales bacterium]
MPVPAQPKIYHILHEDRLPSVIADGQLWCDATIAARADSNTLRWAFTPSNAGAYYFEDYADWAQLDRVDWDAVQARDWRAHKHGKQAEFLVEQRFPWELVMRIGVQSIPSQTKVRTMLQQAPHRPPVEHMPSWYYG